MIAFNIGRLELRFTFAFFAVVSCFVLMDRAVFALYLVLPVIIHELGHILALTLCGAGIRSVTFTAVSVDMQKKNIAGLSYKKEILINAAGILANLIVAIWLYCTAFQSVRTMFLIAANIAVAIFNLLPIGNLDGGELVRLLGERYGGVEFGHRLSWAASFMALTPLSAVAILLFLRGENITLLITCVYLALVIIKRE